MDIANQKAINKLLRSTFKNKDTEYIIFVFQDLYILSKNEKNKSFIKENLATNKYKKKFYSVFYDTLIPYYIRKSYDLKKFVYDFYNYAEFDENMIKKYNFSKIFSEKIFQVIKCDNIELYNVVSFFDLIKENLIKINDIEPSSFLLINDRELLEILFTKILDIFDEEYNKKFLLSLEKFFITNTYGYGYIYHKYINSPVMQYLIKKNNTFDLYFKNKLDITIFNEKLKQILDSLHNSNKNIKYITFHEKIYNLYLNHPENKELIQIHFKNYGYHRFEIFQSLIKKSNDDFIKKIEEFFSYASHKGSINLEVNFNRLIIVFSEEKYENVKSSFEFLNSKFIKVLPDKITLDNINLIKDIKILKLCFEYIVSIDSEFTDLLKKKISKCLNSMFSFTMIKYFEEKNIFGISPKDFGEIEVYWTCIMYHHSHTDQYAFNYKDLEIKYLFETYGQKISNKNFIYCLNHSIYHYQGKISMSKDLFNFFLLEIKKRKININNKLFYNNINSIKNNTTYLNFLVKKSENMYEYVKILLQTFSEIDIEKV